MHRLSTLALLHPHSFETAVDALEERGEVVQSNLHPHIGGAD